MLMRKRTIRKGLQFILVALFLIILASYYHSELAGFFAFSVSSEERFYGLEIFLAAATGSYGVVLTVFGFVLSGDARDAGIRLLPVFLLIVTAVMLFFFLLISSLNGTSNPVPLPPRETITI